MIITKKQIEFFKSYITDDPARPVLEQLYLDLDTLREFEGKRFARLVATSGFVLGSIEVELTEKDTFSFYFSYEDLNIAKLYLKRDSEFVTVEKINDEIFYRTFGATIKVGSPDHGEFPDYKKAISNIKDPEYIVKVSAKLLMSIARSHIKLGYSDVSVHMSGSKNPIKFKNFDEEITSILMPQTTDEKGELQK